MKNFRTANPSLSRLGLLLALMASACHRPPAGAADAAPAVPMVNPPPVAQTPVPVAGPAPTRKVVRQPPMGQQIGLLQIMLSHKDVRAPWVPNRSKTRTPAEAEKIARRLSQEARHGADFVQLAKTWSDWPFAAQNGGQLGILAPGAGNMPELAEQGAKLEIGGISDPIPTQFGYAVIKRLPLVRISHIVIGYAGLPGNRQTRTREEAEQLATRVHDDIASGKISFADAAFEYSDEVVSAGRGGDIGSFEEKSPQMPQIHKVAVALRKGEISAPFDSPLGFEILQRTE